jgi:hypothetical protein
MESHFASLKTERTAAKTDRTRNVARADVLDDIDRLHNQRRQHSTLGYVCRAAFEAQIRLAYVLVHRTECRPILADGVGFEPTVGLHPRRFSRPVP